MRWPLSVGSSELIGDLVLIHLVRGIRVAPSADRWMRRLGERLVAGP